MATINILGEIGASVKAEDVIKQIQSAKGDKLKVLIASPGGSAVQGLMIHEALKTSGKEVTTVALGLGASAAFIIFLAGDRREMGDTSLLMGHSSRNNLSGTAAKIREDLAAMDAIDERMKSAIMAASGMSDKDATELLSKDTFMNSETAIELGLATDSIQDDIAASLNMNKTKKEPVKMADEETKETGLIAFFKALVSREVKAQAEEAKAEDEEKPEEEEAKADAEADESNKEAKAEDTPEQEEEAKAEGDEDKEKEEMKARIESLETELAATKAKAEGDEEEKKEEAAAKINLILSGISDKKVTMKEATKLSSQPLSEVSAQLGDLQANATGRGKTQEPKEEATSSKLDQWKAMKTEGNHGAAQKFYNENSNEIRSEMSKEK
tara:strand:+ start:2254 stop:3405 length:1152 start_codon:yes stop_codon:yes gene_type:complete